MNTQELLALILYRDASMLVLNKPHGIPVHIGSGKLKPLENYFDRLRFGLKRAPALAHRLDKDTSGCLVLGRHPQALRKLNELFAHRKIKKTYWAIVHGGSKQTEGTIDLPLLPDDSKSGWRMKVSDQGKPSVTDYRIIDQHNGYSWLELTPHTGRTHQIRVHCAALGMPIIGDDKYGSQENKRTQLCLHARSVLIPFYKNKDPIFVEAAPPEHMNKLIKVITTHNPS